MEKRNWTGWNVGKFGVRKVPRNPKLFGWCNGRGSVIVDENYLDEEELEQELNRLYGGPRNRTSVFADIFGNAQEWKY